MPVADCLQTHRSWLRKEPGPGQHCQIARRYGVLLGEYRLIQRPVNQSFGLVESSVGLVGLAKICSEIKYIHFFPFFVYNIIIILICEFFYLYL